MFSSGNSQPLLCTYRWIVCSCWSMVCSFTCPGLETLTYAATRMALLLTVGARNGIGFSLQSPLQEPLVGSVPTSAGVRALYCLSADSVLAFHMALRVAQLRAEGKPDWSPSFYVCWEADSPGSGAGAVRDFRGG